MRLPRPLDREKRNSPVERHQAARVANRKGEQIEIGDLLGSKNVLTMKDVFVGERDVVRPEGVPAATCGSTQSLNRIVHGDRVRILRLRQDANEPVLGQRTGCPSGGFVPLPPGVGALVMYVRGIEKSDQYVDVEERAHASGLFFEESFDELRRHDGSPRRKEGEPVSNPCLFLLSTPDRASRELGKDLARGLLMGGRQLFYREEDVVVDVQGGPHDI